MAMAIVDFPMKNGGSFHSFLYVYQRVDFLHIFFGAKSVNLCPTEATLKAPLRSWHGPRSCKLGGDEMAHVVEKQQRNQQDLGCCQPFLDFFGGFSDLAWDNHQDTGIWQWNHGFQYILVGGLEHGFYFSIYWEESSQLTFTFFRGVGIPPTSNNLYIFLMGGVWNDQPRIGNYTPTNRDLTNYIMRIEWNI